MNEITLESLARRVEALERALRIPSQERGRDDWQRVLGMFAGSEFMKKVDEEGRKLRETERAEAQEEGTAE